MMHGINIAFLVCIDVNISTKNIFRSIIVNFFLTLTSLVMLGTMGTHLSAAAEAPNNNVPQGVVGGGYAAPAANALTAEQRQQYIQYFIDAGHAWAVRERLHELADAENPAMHEFIEQWAEQGNFLALHFKVVGLLSGAYGYQPDQNAARAFLENQATNGNPAAIQFKARALSRGEFGFRKNVVEARNFLDYWVAQGNPGAIREKGKNLVARGFYAYGAVGEFDQVHFIDHWVAQGNAGAIEIKALGLWRGVFGYVANPGEARAFLEGLVEQENPAAIELKAEGLVLGSYGYEGVTTEEIEEFINPAGYVLK